MNLQSSNWFLYFVTITANLFSFTIGCLLAWNSPVLPQLQSNNTDINPMGRPITIIEVSIASSIIPISSTIGTILIGPLAEIFGRKRTLVYLAAGVMTSFAAISFARDIYVYLTFLASACVCTSAAFLVVPVYVAEIAEDSNRGKLGCFASVSIALGQLYIYVLGTVTNFGIISLFCGLPALLFLIFSILLPESPMFLASKGDTIEALDALKKVRKHKTLIELNTEFSEKEKMLEKRSKEETKDIRVLFKTRAGKKAVLISIVVRVTQQLSGMILVLSFLSPLLEEAGTTISVDALTIIVASVNVLVAVLALNIIERKGRRFLLLLACFFDGLSMFVLGLYFVFKENNYVLSNIVRVIPVIALLTFVCMFTFGLGNVPFVVISEIIPNEVRSVGSSIVLVTGNLSAFAVCFAYPIVANVFGTYTCMFAFSFFCFTGFILIYFLLPETKGKSFSEIKMELEK